MALEAAEDLKKDGLSTEILISDNGSTDGSQKLARSLGARVTECPHRGYGNALIWGGREARGRYIVMGDSDASYDFRDGAKMVRKLTEGYELCMGTRLKGTIMPGAMPWKNQHIGNPILTGILNLFFRSGLSDAHCGLRAFTKDAFSKMQLESQGMEFASEMVVKAAILNLKRTEIPTTLHKDGRDRPPHLQPWRDGWRHLKFLLVYSPLWLFFIPALLSLLVGGGIIALLLSTPGDALAQFAGLQLGDHWLPIASAILIVGYQFFLLGVVSCELHASQEFVSERLRGT